MKISKRENAYIAPAKMKRFEKLIRREIERVGCGYDDLGPYDAIFISTAGDQFCTISSVNIDADPEDLLRILQALPEGVGWKTTWRSLIDEVD